MVEPTLQFKSQIWLIQTLLKVWQGLPRWQFAAKWFYTPTNTSDRNYQFPLIKSKSQIYP